MQLLPTAVCLLHMVPCEEGGFVIFVAVLKLVEYCDELPTEPFLLQAEKT